MSRFAHWPAEGVKKWGQAPRAKIRRRGFTLVELLVVITIIGILMGLLIPVVGRVREMAHRTSCMNNQTQIGLAVQLYATSTGKMPPEMTQFTETIATASAPAGTIYELGWAENLLTQLGRPDLAPGSLPVYTLRTNNASTPTATGGPPTLAILICPSDSNKSGSTGGPLSYVVNGGCPNYGGPTLNGTVTPVDWNANGAWNYSAQVPGSYVTQRQGFVGGVIKTALNPVYNTNITLEYIGKHDGTSMTISTSENLDATTYSYGSYPENGATLQTENSQAILWYPGQTSGNPPINYNLGNPAGTINTTTGGSNNLGNPALARPSSNHPGGAVFGFCDGSVKFISQSMSYNVYAALMTSSGTNLGVPGDNRGSGATGYTNYAGTQLVQSGSTWIELPLDASLIPTN